MYAIVEIAGKQFKVEKGDKIRVPKVVGEVNEDVVFDNVLLISNEGQTSIGQPSVEGAKVKATIENFRRDKKILVFKMKRRKGYRVKNGHRQDFTSLTIKNISISKKKSGEEADGA